MFSSSKEEGVIDRSKDISKRLSAIMNTSWLLITRENTIMTWTCTACTFDNVNDTFLACAECGSERSTTIRWDLFPDEIDSPKRPTRAPPRPPSSPVCETPKSTKEQSKEDKLKPICEELVQTERTYVKEIDAIVTVFLQPLRTRAQETDSSILTESEVNSIFGNIAEILQVNTALLEKFDQCSQQPESSTSEERAIQLCKAFLDYASHLKMYAAYAIQYDTAASRLKRLESERFRFGEFLNAASAMNGVTMSQPLSSFLIKPIQRICKYPLFFNQMLKVVEDDKDSALSDILKMAYDAAEEVASKINSEKLRVEQNFRAIEVAKRLDNLSEVLLEPFRRYVGEWNCLISEGHNSLAKKRRSMAKTMIVGEKKPRTCFLFSDVLLLTKEVGTANKLKFELKLWISLDQLQVIGINPGSGPSKLLQSSTDEQIINGVPANASEIERSFRQKFTLPLDVLHIASTDREKNQDYRERQQSVSSSSRRRSFLRKKQTTGNKGNSSDTIITTYTMWFRSAAERRRVLSLLQKTHSEFERKSLVSPVARHSITVDMGSSPVSQKTQDDQKMIQSKFSLKGELENSTNQTQGGIQDYNQHLVKPSNGSKSHSSEPRNHTRPRPPPPPPPETILASIQSLKIKPVANVEGTNQSKTGDDDLISKWFGNSD